MSSPAPASAPIPSAPAAAGPVAPTSAASAAVAASPTGSHAATATRSPAVPTASPAVPQSASLDWQRLFENWPDTIPRNGIVVNTLNEALPFKGFMLAGEMVLLERTNPDQLGARYIVMKYDSMELVKIIHPLKTDSFLPLGFKGKLSN